jgi:beta-glucosidase
MPARAGRIFGNPLIMKPIKNALSHIALLILCIASAFAQDRAPSCCGRQFTVKGGVSYLKIAQPVSTTGNVPREAFAGSVSGKSFTCAVPGLEAGKYIVEIGFAETEYNSDGRRVFDIRCGNIVLEKDLDIHKAAGGFARMHRVAHEVEHAGDALRGPLAITFTAGRGLATFNAILVSDATGKPVACLLAGGMADARDPVATAIPEINDPIVYNDPAHEIDTRVDDLIRRMSLKEKISQMVNGAEAIERLGIPAYDWWSEGLHGVAGNGCATVFPQAIAMAATWNPELIHKIGDATGTEFRAKYNEVGRDKDHARYQGLTVWSPNINICRDPRWGRGQETYGEDPFLTARLGVAYIQGLQGPDPGHLKVAACAKHYAVHSGPEEGRHGFNATPPGRDIYETYLPQFEAAVREGKVASIMTAYNAVGGEPCGASALLLQTLLRERWGFDGHVGSDCGAIGNIHYHHKKTPSLEEAVARAVKAGCDLDCGETYASLIGAFKQGLVTMPEIDRALHRLFKTRFRLGMFDPAENDPYAGISPKQYDTPGHNALALQAARESIVLLKNNGVLPLDKNKLRKVAVMGGNAGSVWALAGNYSGTPSHPVTFAQGLRAALGDAKINVVAGCPLVLAEGENFAADSSEYIKAMNAALDADAVIYIGGISPQYEGEEMKVNIKGFRGGDRTLIELPEVQTNFLKALHATGKPVVYVNCSGGAIAMPWEAENLPAIVQAWYPGQQGGAALAEILLGDYNPGGRLPLTFYRSTDDLPPFESYDMAGRTYRYFKGKPLFPFGHGLSYATFSYGKLGASAKTAAAADTIRVTLEIKNTGMRDGDEVVQLYARHADSKRLRALKTLVAFRRVSIPKQTSSTITMEFSAGALRYWDEQTQQYGVESGNYELQAAASAADVRNTVFIQIRAPLK